MEDSTENNSIECPFCGETILAVAKKCRYCEEYLDPSARPSHSEPGDVERLFLPVGRPGSAIAAGYLALFAILPIFGLIPAILAVFYGRKALREIKENPQLAGKGRAWFGIIIGSIMILLSILLILLLIVGQFLERL